MLQFHAFISPKQAGPVQKRTGLILLLTSVLIAGSMYVASPPRAAQAAPANPQAFDLVQPNGTSVRVYAVGDEYQHRFVTGDGYTILQDTVGFWTYAMLDPLGHLVAGTRRVGLDVPPPVPLHLRSIRDERLQPQNTSGTQQTRYNATGVQPVVILLVQFVDQPPIGSTPTDWQQTFFNPTESVADYYHEASQGALQLVPAAETFGTPNDGVVGWITLPYPHPNVSSVGQAVRKIASDAAAAADSYINYASFDTNGNGSISSSELHIVVVFAGYEGSYSPANKCGNAIWGHRANLAELVTLDNVLILNASGDGGYAGVGEWHCTSTSRPGHRATIGPIIHEMGHDLGLPDLYDTDNSSYGIGTWSPMSLGAWNTLPGQFAGRKPAHHDAFSRAYLGWMTPTLVTSSQTELVLDPAEISGQALQFIPNPNEIDWEFRYHSGQGEYYLVENRQRIGYDAGLPGCGLLIWHINESSPFSNLANADEELRLINLQQADGLDDLRLRTNTGDSGDPFPGSTGSTSFGRFTKPGSVLYSGAFSGITLTNILAANPDCPTSSLAPPLSIKLSGKLSGTLLGTNQPTRLQASSTPAATLSIPAVLPASTLDFSIRMKVIVEGSAIPITPTPVPTPIGLKENIYLPLLWR